MDGVRSFFGGIGFVVRSAQTWGFAAVPAMVMVVLASLLCVAGVAGAEHLADLWVTGTDELAIASHMVRTTLLALLAIAGALLVAISLAQPLSGFALEAIVRRQDRALGLPAWPALPFARTMAHTLAATFIGLCAWLVAFGGLSVVSLLFPPLAVVTIPLKLVASALLIAWDLLDYPFGLRGIGISARFAFIADNFGAVLCFGLLGALVALTPLAGLLLLPFGVAGAARLVARVQDASSPTLI